MISLLLSLSTVAAFAAPKPLDSAWIKFEVNGKTFMTESSIQSAEASENSETHRWNILVQLNKQGTKKFREMTKKNVGKKLSVIVDGTELMAPVIQTTIEHGNILISTNFSKPEIAKEMVRRMNIKAGKH